MVAIGFFAYKQVKNEITLQGTTNYSGEMVA